MKPFICNKSRIRPCWSPCRLDADPRAIRRLRPPRYAPRLASPDRGATRARPSSRRPACRPAGRRRPGGAAGGAAPDRAPGRHRDRSRGRRAGGVLGGGARRAHPLLLTDVMMPGLTGPQACERDPSAASRPADALHLRLLSRRRCSPIIGCRRARRSSRSRSCPTSSPKRSTACSARRDAAGRAERGTAARRAHRPCRRVGSAPTGAESQRVPVGRSSPRRPSLRDEVRAALRARGRRRPGAGDAGLHEVGDAVLRRRRAGAARRSAATSSPPSARRRARPGRTRARAVARRDASRGALRRDRAHRHRAARRLADASTRCRCTGAHRHRRVVGLRRSHRHARLLACCSRATARAMSTRDARLGAGATCGCAARAILCQIKMKGETDLDAALRAASSRRSRARVLPAQGDRLGAARAREDRRRRSAPLRPRASHASERPEQARSAESAAARRHAAGAVALTRPLSVGVAGALRAARRRASSARAPAPPAPLRPCPSLLHPRRVALEETRDVVEVAA